MRKALALVLFAAAVLPTVGCSSLQYEEKRADGGVISFKASERDAAVAKLRQDYGNVEIVAEYDAKAAKPGGAFDPTAPVKPSERVASTGPFGALTASGDEGTMRIKFVKKPAAGTGTTPAGLPPAPKDDGLMQAGYSTKSAYDRNLGNSSALPQPNMSGMGGPVQGVVDCKDGTCPPGR